VNAQIAPMVRLHHQAEYKEGSLVRKGQVLFEIDPRPFKAASIALRATLRRHKHSLARAFSMWSGHALAEARAIAKSQLDKTIQAKARRPAAIESNKVPWSGGTQPGVDESHFTGG